jgi:RHS repeat-associated protein
MSIVDETGTPVATYEYDPYGNIVTATGTLAEVNPLRYRGYYFDSESGLYYLQSRYYDPEIGCCITSNYSS